MTIYVSNLNFHLQNNESGNLSAIYRTVESVKISTDRITHQSKGFAIVEMTNNDAGNEAIAKLNGQITGGRIGVENMANTREKAIPPAIFNHFN